MVDTKRHAADFDRLIETECTDCFVRVTGFKDDNFSELFINLFSPHIIADQSKLKSRIKRAWKILRSGYEFDIELMSKQDTDDLIQALEDARSVLYPTAPEG